MKDINKLLEITSSYSILYVEDDLETAKTIMDYLSKIFKVVVFAENGQEALELYKQMDFELVLTDINMPIMNGLDLSAEIKKIHKNQNIIVVSAHSDIDLFISSIQLGIEGYIIKPVNYDDLNNLLYKMAKKIQKYKQYKQNKKELKKLVRTISRKNSELDQYHEILDNVAIVSKTDLKGYITYANDYFSKVSGYSKEELIGSNHNIVRHPDMPKSIYKNLWDTIKSGKTWKGSIKNQTKSGETYFAYAIIMPMYDEKSKEIIEYMGIRFLTTKEENEKREFKKKILTNYQELRKNDYESAKKIKVLEESVKKLTNDKVQENALLEKIKIKNKKLLTQINFYESEISKKDLNFTKSLDNAHATVKETNELYKKALAKIELLEKENKFIKKDDKLRKKEIIKLNEKLIDQRSIIIDLKSIIKDMNDKSKNNEEEKSFLDKILHND